MPLRPPCGICWLLRPGMIAALRRRDGIGNRLVRSGERRTEPRTRRSRQERVRLTHAAIGHNRGFSADSASSALIVIVMAWQAARKFASAVAAWQRNLRIIQ